MCRRKSCRGRRPFGVVPNALLVHRAECNLHDVFGLRPVHAQLRSTITYIRSTRYSNDVEFGPSLAPRMKNEKIHETSGKKKALMLGESASCSRVALANR